MLCGKEERENLKTYGTMSTQILHELMYSTIKKHSIVEVDFIDIKRFRLK